MTRINSRDLKDDDLHVWSDQPTIDGQNAREMAFGRMKTITRTKNVVDDNFFFVLASIRFFSLMIFYSLQWVTHTHTHHILVVAHRKTFVCTFVSLRILRGNAIYLYITLALKYLISQYLAAATGAAAAAAVGIYVWRMYVYMELYPTHR